LFHDPANHDYNTTSSNIVDQGTVFGTFNGAAKDIGVFEPPVLKKCEIGNVNTNTLVCKWENKVFPPISACNKGAFTVTVEGKSRKPIACTIAGSSQTKLVFDGSGVQAGQKLRVDLAYGAVRDSANIGGPEKHLNGQSAPVTNRAVKNSMDTIVQLMPPSGLRVVN
jgi:hypothetical protein